MRLWLERFGKVVVDVAGFSVSLTKHGSFPPPCWHGNPEIVALKQLFPKIGSPPRFPLLLLSSVWNQKSVNKWEAVLVCSTLQFSGIIPLLVFMFFGWGLKHRPLKGQQACQANREEVSNVVHNGCKKICIDSMICWVCCYLAHSVQAAVFLLSAPYHLPRDL